jgi:8-oxo-dGTP pyrophosphatase MutT (NUDIX family)
VIPGLDAEVDAYLRRHPGDRPRLSALLAQMASGDDYSLRSNMTGHVVSSVITLDHARLRALLVLHGAYGIWIPPGGHYESPGTAYESALRERVEETGLRRSRPAGGAPFLLDVDTHPIPARADKGEGPHFHHDFMYLELADEPFDPRIQAEEVRGAEWRPLAAMLDEGGRMRRLAQRVLALPQSMLD